MIQVAVTDNRPCLVAGPGYMSLILSKRSLKMHLFFFFFFFFFFWLYRKLRHLLRFQSNQRHRILYFTFTTPSPPPIPSPSYQDLPETELTKKILLKAYDIVSTRGTCSDILRYFGQLFQREHDVYTMYNVALMLNVMTLMRRCMNVLTLYWCSCYVVET